jgi:hypothetical protein
MNQVLSESGEFSMRATPTSTAKAATRGDYVISDQVPCRFGELGETRNRWDLLGRVDSNHRLPDPESGNEKIERPHEFWRKFKRNAGSGAASSAENQVSFPKKGNPP